MSAFLDALHSGRVLLMDGAMGTELQRAGISPGECYEVWNLTQPAQVLSIHRTYVESGAEVLLTNTFQAHPATAARHGLQDMLPRIQAAGVELARSAAGRERFVLADIGPAESPGSCPAEFLAPYRLADGILFETMSDFEFLKQTLPNRPESERLPVLISFSFLRDAHGELRTHRGLVPEEIAAEAARLGVAALGTNCGRDISLNDMADVVRRYRSATALPLFARPNAGTPKRAGNGWEYPSAPESMAERLQDLLQAGVNMVGGCCGTTPAHIAAFRAVLAAWNAELPRN